MVRSIAKFATNILELFADFKFTRTFWDTAMAPAPFFADVWTDATHPFLISNNGISVPIQNPFNPFTVPDYTSRADLILGSGSPPTSFTVL